MSYYSYSDWWDNNDGHIDDLVPSSKRPCLFYLGGSSSSCSSNSFANAGSFSSSSSNSFATAGSFFEYSEECKTETYAEHLARTHAHHDLKDPGK